VAISIRVFKERRWGFTLTEVVAQFQQEKAVSRQLSVLSQSGTAEQESGGLGLGLRNDGEVVSGQ
jgi:predicted Zn-dependent protease